MVSLIIFYSFYWHVLLMNFSQKKKRFDFELLVYFFFKGKFWFFLFLLFFSLLARLNDAVEDEIFVLDDVIIYVLAHDSSCLVVGPKLHKIWERENLWLSERNKSQFLSITFSSSKYKSKNNPKNGKIFKILFVEAPKIYNRFVKEPADHHVERDSFNRLPGGTCKRK